MSDASVTLDLRGTLCPIPVIRTQDAIKDLDVGTVVDVLATDPGTLYDIPAWCRIHGHQVLNTQEQDREIRIRIQVSA